MVKPEDWVKCCDRDINHMANAMVPISTSREVLIIIVSTLSHNMSIVLTHMNVVVDVLKRHVSAVLVKLSLIIPFSRSKLLPARVISRGQHAIDRVC